MFEVFYALWPFPPLGGFLGGRPALAISTEGGSEASGYRGFTCLSGEQDVLYVVYLSLVSYSSLLFNYTQISLLILGLRKKTLSPVRALFDIFFTNFFNVINV